MRTRDMIIYGVGLLVVVLIFASYRTPNTIEEVDEMPILNPDLGGVMLSDFIEMECERQSVDKWLVYAIINSPRPDAEPRYGLMKLHVDLIEKYNVNWSDGEGVIENPKANAIAGIGRLKWCMENNSSIDGALMVYIYTKPIAQKMWADGIKTTKWVESVKGEL